MMPSNRNNTTSNLVGTVDPTSTRFTRQEDQLSMDDHRAAAFQTEPVSSNTSNTIGIMKPASEQVVVGSTSSPATRIEHQEGKCAHAQGRSATTPTSARTVSSSCIDTSRTAGGRQKGTPEYIKHWEGLALSHFRNSAWEGMNHNIILYRVQFHTACVCTYAHSSLFLFISNLRKHQQT